MHKVLTSVKDRSDCKSVPFPLRYFIIFFAKAYLVSLSPERYLKVKVGRSFYLNLTVKTMLFIVYIGC